MKTVANILWIIFGGLLIAILWAIIGIILCLTIIGIPFGIQCFKFAELMLCPFGKEVVYSNRTVSFLFNILWLLIFGWELTLVTLSIGFIWCLTIIGFPIGLQVIKLAKLTFMPFGAEVV